MIDEGLIGPHRFPFLFLCGWIPLLPINFGSDTVTGISGYLDLYIHGITIPALSSESLPVYPVDSVQSEKRCGINCLDLPEQFI